MRHSAAAGRQKTKRRYLTSLQLSGHFGRPHCRPGTPDARQAASAAAIRTASPHGLGLGLSIVAEIAQAHGANLDVEARPEGGLTVAVSFP